MSEPRRLTIDIWSDVMCPWCLVGWGNLRQALESLQDEIEADIRWHAFELNPDMPESGEERSAHIARKYGRSVQEARGVQDRMREAARRAGVSLDYEGSENPESPAPEAMMWNTLAAHTLLAWTGEVHGPQRQTDLKLALFAAHFNQRRNVASRDVLLEIAAETGLARDEAARALGSDDYTRKVRADERAAWDMNVTGVPAMVIDGKFMIPGAQPPEAYADALRRVAAKTSAAV